MSGVNLQYVASSGNIYNLRGNTLRTRRKTNFHKWTWSVNGVNLQYGMRVSGFSRPGQTYETTLTLFGSEEQKRAQIEALHDDFELDVRNETPGRIIWGSYYIDCFVIGSSLTPNNGNMSADNVVSFYCPYPFWIKEETRRFYPQSAGGAETFLDYPHGYDYDYFSGGSGTQIWQTGFPFTSDFRMIMYGPASNPRVLINDHIYQILDTLAASEHVIIDSKLGTIVKTQADGTKVNAFDLRNKEESIFEKIPAGTLTFNWSGAFGFDLTLYEERSEPR